MPDAYDFQLLREELVEGRRVYVISAKPRPEYRPRDTRARILGKIQGTLWIDKEELQWVRMEATSIGTISFGWFLARFRPGARLYFEQSRVNDEVWLPQRAGEAQGRLAILEKLRGAFEVSWTNYRKFPGRFHGRLHR